MNQNGRAACGRRHARHHGHKIEDSLCRDFGAKPLPGAKAERTRIIYGWGAQDARSLMYQPIVWHLTRDLDGCAYMVSGPPRTKGGGTLRVVY